MNVNVTPRLLDVSVGDCLLTTLPKQLYKVTICQMCVHAASLQPYWQRKQIKLIDLSFMVHFSQTRKSFGNAHEDNG